MRSTSTVSFSAGAPGRRSTWLVRTRLSPSCASRCGSVSACRTIQPSEFERAAETAGSIHLIDKTPGDRRADDAWVDRLAMTIYRARPTEAAEAAAAALAEGISPEDVGEAISLASNRLLLCDQGRVKGAPAGKCLQEACMATRSACMPRTRPTPGETSPGSATPAIHSPALIVAAFQNTVRPEHEGPLKEQPLPLPAHLEKITAKDAARFSTTPRPQSKPMTNWGPRRWFIGTEN